MHFKPFQGQISSQVNIMNVNAEQGLNRPAGGSGLDHRVPPLRASKQAELCVSRDINKMHMAKGVYTIVGSEPKRPVEKFLFLRQNDEDLS